MAAIELRYPEITTMTTQDSILIDFKNIIRAKGRSFLVWMVRKLDAVLKDYFQIFEYTGGKECILRLALARNEDEIVLADGTCISAGETIGELHFWNEHIPPIAVNCTGLTWALLFQRRLIRSLEELAVYVDRHPDFSEVNAFRGELFFGARCKVLQMSKSVKRCGFEIVSKDSPTGRRGFVSCFWQVAYNMALVWAYNSASLKDKKLGELKRCHLWMSRRVLLDKYLGKKRYETAIINFSPQPSGLVDTAEKNS